MTVKQWIFIRSIKHGPLRLIRYLLPKVRSDTALMDTSLPLAIRLQRQRVVRVLIEAGAPMDTLNGIGNSALHYAAMGSNPAIVGLLLEAGAVVDIQTERYRDSPLQLVAQNTAAMPDQNRVDIATLLVQAGADINYRNRKGSTPLHDAIWCGYNKNHAVARYLVEAGADLMMGNAGRYTPLGWARENGVEELIPYLQQNGGVENRGLVGMSIPMTRITIVDKGIQDGY